MTITCTNHCGQCSRHFHSLEAFDLHHARDESGWPICLDPIDLVDRDGRERLVALTTRGECRIYERVVGVTIWTVVGYERARRLRKAPESSGQPV